MKILLVFLAFVCMALALKRCNNHDDCGKYTCCHSPNTNHSWCEPTRRFFNQIFCLRDCHCDDDQKCVEGDGVFQYLRTCQSK